MTLANNLNNRDSKSSGYILNEKQPPFLLHSSSYCGIISSLIKKNIPFLNKSLNA